MLEVIKRYKSGGVSKVFIRAMHPTNPQCADLLLKKNSELKTIIRTEDIECVFASITSKRIDRNIQSKNYILIEKIIIII